jgi:WD40 repeat protein
MQPEGLVSIGKDGIIKHWTRQGDLVYESRFAKKIVKAVAFSAETEREQRFFVAGFGHKLSRFDMKGKKVASLEDRKSRGAFASTTAIAISPDSRYVVSGHFDTHVRIWDLKGKLLARLLPHKLPVDRVAISPDEKTLFSFAGPILRIWDFVDGSLQSETMFKELSAFSKLVYNPQNGQLLSHEYQKQSIDCWSSDGRLARRIILPWQIKNFALSRDGRVLYCVDLSVQLWGLPLDGGKPEKIKLPGKTGLDLRVDASGDDRFLVWGRGKKDATGAVLSLSGKKLKTIKTTPKSWVVDASLALERYVTFEMSEKAYALWNLESDRIATIKWHDERLPDSYLWPRLDPHNGHLLYFNRGSVIEIFDAYTGDKISDIRTADHFCSLNRIGPLGAGYFYAISEKRKLFLFSGDGKILHQFHERHDILDVVLYPDNLFLATRLADGSIRLRNLQDNSPTANMMLKSNGDEWVMFSDDAYFDASPNGGTAVAAVRGVELFGIDQLALTRNRPDILLSRLGNASKEILIHYRARHARRLRKAGIEHQEGEILARGPVVSLNSSSQDGKRITLAFSVVGSQNELRAYNIHVNDTPLFTGLGKSISGNAGQFEETIELTTGENKIEITAVDVVGVESFRALTYALHANAEPQDLYFVGIGVSKYADPTLDLGYAAKDAEDLEQLFASMQKKFRDVHTKTLLDEQVSPESIRALKPWLSQSTVDDVVVVFIAGHGVHDSDAEGTYYYLTHGADTKSLSSTAADFELLESLFVGIKPRLKFLLMDTCESGELDEDEGHIIFAEVETSKMRARSTRGLIKKLKQNRASAAPRSYLQQKDRFIYNDLLRRSGTIIFSSSRGGELSYESPVIENGYFTEELLNAFSSTRTDADNDGLVSTDELRRSVIEAVSKRSEGRQHPTVDRDNLYVRICFPLVD